MRADEREGLKRFPPSHSSQLTGNMTDTSTPAGPIDVNEVIAIMLDNMASIAWQKLGLQPDPMTGTIAKDLGQAKMAIDAASALSELIQGVVDDADRRSLQNLIRDLRVNYVEKVKEEQSATS